MLNNSSEYILEFYVSNDEELVIDHVLNYPNPFTTKTQFWFEHNKPGQDLLVKVQIFSLTGRVVKTIKQTINDAEIVLMKLNGTGEMNLAIKLGGEFIYTGLQ